MNLKRCLLLAILSLSSGLAFSANSRTSKTTCLSVVSGESAASKKDSLDFLDKMATELRAQDASGALQRLFGQVTDDRGPLSPAGQQKIREFIAAENGSDFPLAPPLLDGPIEERVAQGLSLQQALGDAKIPEAFRSYYSERGVFNYKRAHAERLSVESGRSPLMFTRMNYFENDAEGNSTFISLLGSHVKALALLPQLELVIVYPAKQETALKDTLKKIDPSLRVRIHQVEVEGVDDLFAWAQDGSKPLGTVAKTLLQRDGTSVKQPAYAQATQALEDAGLVEVIPSLLRFEGGNVISGEAHIFVGADILHATVDDFGLSVQDALALLTEEFGAPVIPIGYPDIMGVLRQVDYHIDLTMALVYSPRLKREVAVVQSAAVLLEKVLGFPRIDNLDEEGWRAAKEAVLVRFKDEIIKGKRPLLTKNERRFFEELNEMDLGHIRDMELKFAAVKAQLEKLGYPVVRIPGRTDLRVGFFENRALEAFNYVNASFSGDVALVGQYDIPWLDEAAYEVFRELGFRVHPIQSHATLMMDNGGIRCSGEYYRGALPLRCPSPR